jgi:streptomycin 6-kinase
MASADAAAKERTYKRSGHHGWMDGLTMPRNLVDAVDLEGRQAWLATVPGIVDELCGLWTLEIGEAHQPGGQTAWVAPARDRSGSLLVLKIGWEHPEAVHEAEALRTARNEASRRHDRVAGGTM